MRLKDWTEPYGEASRRVRTRLFDDLAELLSFAESSQPGGMSVEDRQVSSNSRSQYRNGEWHGSPSWESSLAMAHNGWPEGRTLVEAITARFESITASKLTRPQVAYDVAGDCVDVGRYVTGEPENMMVWEAVEVENAGKIVRIEANLSASAAISPAQMAMRGAAIVALVDALEQSGKSVELVVSFSTCARHRRLEGFCPIKAAGEPLDVDRLAFMLANSSFFRRIIFGAWENEPEEWRNPIGITRSGTYGKPGTPSGGDFTADITAPRMLLQTTAEACLIWVFKALQEQGINIEGI